MEYSYSSDMFEEDSPYYKRLAPIYHSDNIDHRVYAYREKHSNDLLAGELASTVTIGCGRLHSVTWSE